MDNYIVETKNLTKIFKDFKAVKNLDLKVKEGSIYGFLEKVLRIREKKC